MIEGTGLTEKTEKSFVISWYWMSAASEQYRRNVAMTSHQTTLVLDTLTELSGQIGIKKISIDPANDTAPEMPLWAFFDELETFDLAENEGRPYHSARSFATPLPTPPHNEKKFMCDSAEYRCILTEQIQYGAASKEPTNTH